MGINYEDCILSMPQISCTAVSGSKIAAFDSHFYQKDAFKTLIKNAY
jgi:hypothetical protein